MKTPTLRIARPTHSFDRILKFYSDGLGLQVLGKFEDHDGFNGLILGHAQWPYHLEFTCEPGHQYPPAPSQEHLLVFYLPAPEDFSQAVARLKASGFSPVSSHNPYWDRKGLTFEDPDGYRVVLFQGSWPPSPATSME